MQQEALPFQMNFRSFAMVAILLMLMVSIIRLIVKYAQPYWPLLRGKVLLRMKKNKVANGSEHAPVNNV